MTVVPGFNSREFIDDLVATGMNRRRAIRETRMEFNKRRLVVEANALRGGRERKKSKRVR